jgi:small subunit ribosomal protein S18
MPPNKPKKRGKPPADSARRGGKKKISILTQEKIKYIDWKDVNLLRRFVSDRAKIRARRVTGNSAQQQRDVAMAIKNAREMALLPYTNRITTTRGGRGGDRRGRDDRGRDDRGRDDRGRDDNRPPREERSEKADSDPSQIQNSSSVKTPVENVEAQVETQMPITETNETSENLTTEETTE